MTALDRFTVIDEVFDLLETALVGSGKVLVAIYDDAPATLGGKTPVLIVKDGGIGREYQGMGTERFDNNVYISLETLVAEAVADDGVTTSAVARKRSEIETEISKVISANQRKLGYWRNLSFTGGRSQVIDIEYKDGNPYKMEALELVAEAPDA